MLQTWGGGIHEHLAYCDACDELEIMVWHDATYACAQYPDDFDWLRQSAGDEAVEVATALRNYPSTVL